MYRPNWRTIANYIPLLFTLALGIVNIDTAVDVPMPGEHFELLLYRYSFSLASRGLVLLSGFFLLILTEGLLRRSRTAWQVAIVLSALSAFGHLNRAGNHYFEAGFSVLVLAILLSQHAFYTRPHDPPSIRRSVIIVLSCWVSMLVFGLLSFHLLGQREFGHKFGIGESLVHLLNLYIFFGDPMLVPRTIFARLFISTVYLVAVFGWLTFVLALISPALERTTRHADEQAQAVELVRQFGTSSLDIFKTGTDKQFIFNQEQTAFVAYKLIEPTVLVLGDPVAQDAAAAAEVIQHLCAYTESRGLRLAFQQVSEIYAEQFQKAGFQLLKIGEEAIIDLPALTMEGPEMKDFRTVVRRLERDRYSVKQYAAPLPGGLVQKLQQVTHEWLTLPSRQERTFAQSVFKPESIRQQPVATIEDAEGSVLAFISLQLDYAPKSLALDLLRRRAEIPNGAVDALILQTAFAFRDQGYTRFNLGLAPLAGLGEDEHSNLPEKTLQLFYENLNQFFNYKGLRAFKEKFQPLWEPSYLAYQATYQLPMIGIAILRAAQTKRGLSGAND